MSLLRAIVERKRREVAGWKRRLEGVTSLRSRRTPIDVTRALRKSEGAPGHIIAELKFRSPSAGVIRAHSDGEVVTICNAYESGGASMISVLADGPGFGGSIANVARARKAVSLPLLFKEFVVDNIQLDLAHFAGADAVLLLANVLQPAELGQLVDGCIERGLYPLVEAANEIELDLALGTRAALIGINARDLHTFKVDRDRADALTNRIPSDRIAIRMSGVLSRANFVAAAAGRADAVLIGEGLMRSTDPAALLRQWLQPSARPAT